MVGPEAYYMGIIDFQQKWNLSKKAERFFKLNFKGADPAGLSSIDPVRYKDRFISRLEELLDVDENEEYLLENRAADEKTDNNIIGGSTISQI